MKPLFCYLLILVIQFSAVLGFPGVGGIGGGSNSADKFVYIKICDGGEAGEQCRVVGLNSNYYDHNGNLKDSAMTSSNHPCFVYEGEGSTVPCQFDSNYGVPQWLQKINKFFGNQSQPPTMSSPSSY